MPHALQPSTTPRHALASGA